MAKRAMTEEAKAAKANLILDQAASWFLTMDYEKIRMADLAKEMGMSNGILYVYFKTKETLFLCLLWREYKKRLDFLEEATRTKRVTCFEDVKELFLAELEYLVDHNPLYIELESRRAVIFEKNTDIQTLFKMKKWLLDRLEVWTHELSRICPLSKHQLINIFVMEAAIITGCRLETDISAEMTKRIEAAGAFGTHRDFKEAVLDGVRYYLDGYGQQLKREKEIQKSMDIMRKGEIVYASD